MGFVTNERAVSAYVDFVNVLAVDLVRNFIVLWNFQFL